MSFPATVYNLLFASPSDLIEERRTAREAAQEWNDLHADAEGVVLLPLMWETHSTPEAGDRPQAIINRQLVANADLLVGLFWTKLGTHTGEAESGTVEEINQMLAAGKQVMLYYSDRPARPSGLDLKQMKKLRAFKLGTYKNALSSTFTSPDQLRQMLMRDLTRVVRGLPRAESSTEKRSGSGIKVTIDVGSLVAGEMRYLIADVLNDGIELNRIRVQIEHLPRDGKGKVLGSLMPKGNVPEPFKPGYSHRYSVSSRYVKTTQEWLTYHPAEVHVVAYSNVREVERVPATQWLDAFKEFIGITSPDTPVVQSPVKSSGTRRRRVSYIE